MIINIAKGRTRGNMMMLPAMSSISLATPDATFGFPEVKIGGIPAITACAMQRRVNQKDMKRIMMLGDSFDASEAQRIGLVDFVGDVELELARLLHRQCAPTTAYHYHKPDLEELEA